MQARMQLSGREGVIAENEWEDISADELIARFKQELKTRGPDTLCVTLQVAFPDPQYVYYRCLIASPNGEAVFCVDPHEDHRELKVSEADADFARRAGARVLRIEKCFADGTAEIERSYQ